MNHPIVVCCENDRKAQTYLRALRELEVPDDRVVLITPDHAPEDAEGLARGAAGLVLCGGPDLHPERYGQEPIEEAGLDVLPELDELDHAVFTAAREERTPVWAICRGMQGVNAFLGGTLWQDLALQVEGAGDHDVDGEPYDFLAHDLGRVDTSSALGRMLAYGTVHVNSRHHQAVRDLAPGLVPVAWAPDGVLEVTEWEGHDWWLRGVQWHPEDIFYMPLQRKLWQQFVTAASAHSAGLDPAGMR